MLPRISILLVFSVVSFHLFANDSTQAWTQWRKEWVKKEIRSAHIHVKDDKKLIGNIELLDIRSDTERVGIYTNDLHKPGELVLDTTLQFLINTKLSNKASSNNLLLVARSFWISEIQNFTGRPGASVAVNSRRPPLTQLKCSIDAFIKQGEEYIPLTQCDTTLTDKNNVVYASHNITEEALIAVQRKLEEALSSNLYNEKKKTSKENITRAYTKRFVIPVLKDTSFKKGIYYTWQQFRDNQPIEKDFSIKATSKNEPPSLFIHEHGNDILVRNVFAVSDGNRLYKLHQGFVFPIYKHKNSIYFPGLEKFDLRTKGAPVGYPLGGGWAAVGLEPVTSVMKIRLTPYLLNIETGEEY